MSLTNENSRICTGECGSRKLLTNFDKNGPNRHPVCKECRSKIRKTLNFPRPPKGTQISCNGPICQGKLLDQNCFNSDKTNHNGLQTYCRQCRRHQTNNRLSTPEGFIKNRYKDLVRNAKKRNIEVHITEKNLLDLYRQKNGKCALTGNMMTHQTSLGDGRLNFPYNISVDRIDSTQSYTVDNIQLVGSIINTMKGSMSTQKFIEICQLIMVNKS